MPKPASTVPLLSISNVTYTYGPLQALTGISLEVRPGDLVVLAGRNGSGKSTLLRIAAGWTRSSAGSVRIADLPVEHHERKIREFVVLVPDAPSFWDELTAWEHLQFVAGVNRLRDWEGRARSLLDQLGLRARLDASPSGYSRGMRYKLGLAMALLLEPQLLLLDEPFGPLDGDAA
ncbi:MAG TPA: ABC transporter ATP-binding protein, partial [Limnochordia bacterium]|nr:ABC transporter ATP-binding protein [Limnochordia bacterium]